MRSDSSDHNDHKEQCCNDTGDAVEYDHCYGRRRRLSQHIPASTVSIARPSSTIYGVLIYVDARRWRGWVIFVKSRHHSVRLIGTEHSIQPGICVSIRGAEGALGGVDAVKNNGVRLSTCCQVDGLACVDVTASIVTGFATDVGNVTVFESNSILGGCQDEWTLWIDGLRANQQCLWGLL